MSGEVPETRPEPDAPGPAGAQPPPPPAEGNAAPALAAVVEALVFAATEPLSMDRLRALTGIMEAADIRAAIEGLRIDYARTGRAFTIEEVGGGFRVLTRPEFAPFIEGLHRREVEARLSPAAMETLAIVAYRQPILRAEVERVRGVDAGGALRTLLDRGLVKVVGRAEEPGSPMLYGTTRRFLEIFGLRSLKDLPKVESLPRPGA